MTHRTLNIYTDDIYAINGFTKTALITLAVKIPRLRAKFQIEWYRDQDFFG